MQQGTIVLTRFWFTEGTDYKIRPALIISNQKFNHIHPYFLMLPLTTSLSAPDYLFPISMSELDKNSFIRTDQVTPIYKDLVLKTLGKLPELELPAIISKMCSNF